MVYLPDKKQKTINIIRKEKLRIILIEKIKKWHQKNLRYQSPTYEYQTKKTIVPSQKNSIHDTKNLITNQNQSDQKSIFFVIPFYIFAYKQRRHPLFVFPSINNVETLAVTNKYTDNPT